MVVVVVIERVPEEEGRTAREEGEEVAGVIFFCFCTDE